MAAQLGSCFKAYPRHSITSEAFGREVSLDSFLLHGLLQDVDCRFRLLGSMLAVLRNWGSQLLLHGDDSGPASTSEEGTLPVGGIVLLLVHHEPVAINDRILCVLLSSRDKDQVVRHHKEIKMSMTDVVHLGFYMKLCLRTCQFVISGHIAHLVSA